MRISDWSSDVCSSDLNREQLLPDLHRCQIRLVDRGITFVIARYDRHVGLVQKDERPDARAGEILVDDPLHRPEIFVLVAAIEIALFAAVAIGTKAHADRKSTRLTSSH